MTIAKDIIYGRTPNIQAYLDEGNLLDDIDEYGFTLLIECAIADRLDVADELLKAGALINQADFSGRTPLHWAIYQSNEKLARFFLDNGADANACSNDGLSILVYPLLRRQASLKHLLYQYGARLDFALDFIQAKLLGHRYELKGQVDIFNGRDAFVELDYEGFILEFSVPLVKEALVRFITNFSTRQFKSSFGYLYPLIQAFDIADALLQLQRVRQWNEAQEAFLVKALSQDMLILPAASRGHAIGFIRYGQFFGVVDRGEHAQKVGSVNIYLMTRPEAFDRSFLKAFLYKRQPRSFFHEKIHSILGLRHWAKLPISSQIVGNCSWANIQALIPTAYYLQQLQEHPGKVVSTEESMTVYAGWLRWDQERALDELIQRFGVASEERKASFAAQLAAVLFQTCDAENGDDVLRAEKILKILTLPKYQYILNSYFETYCIKQLTHRGNNLLKILEDCGINPGIGVNPVATGLQR